MNRQFRLVLIASTVMATLMANAIPVIAQDRAPGLETPAAGPVDLCGGDDRVSSNDPRIGRLVVSLPDNKVSVCTAWLIANGAVLTAGHCVDFDTNEASSGGVDGISDWTGKPVVLEFNVPPSTPAGAIMRPSNPEDVYDIMLGSEVGHFRFFGDGESDGRDWAVFRVQRNAKTKQTAHERQGFFRITNRNPPGDAIIRITGFGKDDGSANSTQQTATGDLDSENSTDGNLWFDYNVDTMGGNSGGPIIWDANGFAIGIHNSGGCDQVLGIFGSNSGSSFDTPDLGPNINFYFSSSPIHVDTVSHPGDPNGWIFNPYNNVQQAVNAATKDARVSIAAGVYRGPVTISKPVTLIAPVGEVTINPR